MIKLSVYSSKGVKKGSTSLPKDSVEKENLLLLAQAIRVYEDRVHKGTSKVKTRGEVRASTAKIWRQKGTGRARHGDIGAPIFVGGGVAHGPKGIKRVLVFPKKMRQRALKVALSLKAKEGKLVVADNLGTLRKTKEAKKLLDSIINGDLKGVSPSKVTVALAKENKNAKVAFRNIKKIEVISYENLNAYTVFFGGLVILDKEAITKNKVSKKTALAKPGKIKSHIKKTKSKRK